jgi:hypothetical protein
MDREERFKYFTIRLITDKNGKECYEVSRNDTGQIKSKCTTLKKAEKQVNILTNAMEAKMARKWVPIKMTKIERGVGNVKDTHHEYRKRFL